MIKMVTWICIVCICFWYRMDPKKITRWIKNGLVKQFQGLRKMVLINVANCLCKRRKIMRLIICKEFWLWTESYKVNFLFAIIIIEYNKVTASIIKQVKSFVTMIVWSITDIIWKSCVCMWKNNMHNTIRISMPSHWYNQYYSPAF